jgi:flagellar biosynthesis anti-sigma factor FlgM
MGIDQSQGAEALLETGRARKQSPASSATSSCSINSFGEDQAQFSGAQVQVQELAARALQLPEIRQEKVSALRQAVLCGTYQPDVEQVAYELFAHMLVQPAS